VLAVSLAEQLEPVAASKEIELKTAAEPDIHVCGDASWLERVVLNLLDNAIKFTPKGGHIQISVASENGYAALRVEDTGMGILPRLSAHFLTDSIGRNLLARSAYQASASVWRSHVGSWKSIAGASPSKASSSRGPVSRCSAFISNGFPRTSLQLTDLK